MATVHRDLDETDARARAVDYHSTDGDDSANFNAPPSSGLPSFLPWPLYRFRYAGNLSLAAGIVTGITAYCWGFMPAWAGFLAGAFCVSVILAVIQAKDDARRSAQRSA